MVRTHCILAEHIERIRELRIEASVEGFLNRIRQSLPSLESSLPRPGLIREQREKLERREPLPYRLVAQQPVVHKLPVISRKQLTPEFQETERLSVVRVSDGETRIKASIPYQWKVTASLVVPTETGEGVVCIPIQEIQQAEREAWSQKAAYYGTQEAHAKLSAVDCPLHSIDSEDVLTLDLSRAYVLVED